MVTWIVSAISLVCFAFNEPTAHKIPSGIVDDLNGKWELYSYENEGVKKLASDRDTTFYRQRILIKGNRWFEWYGGQPAPPADGDDNTCFRCVTKPGMPFRHFDYWPTGPDRKPDTWKKIGIYKLEGDRLTICFRVQSIPGKSVERPSRFDASKGKGTGLAIYKRIKSK